MARPAGTKEEGMRFTLATAAMAFSRIAGPLRRGAGSVAGLLRGSRRGAAAPRAAGAA
jgi:hypothetical protein